MSTNQLIRVRIFTQLIAPLWVVYANIEDMLLLIYEIYIDTIYICLNGTRPSMLSSSYLFGRVGVFLSFCFKLKCYECGICSQAGCFYLKRDVQAENEESKMEMEHMPSPRRDSFTV